MPTFLIDGSATVERLDAADWAAAEVLAAAAGGTVAGELVAESKARVLEGATEFKFDAGGEMLFSGYGAVFGNVDSHGDVLLKGSFAKTIKAHKAAGTMPAMLLNHNPMSLPIGVWTSMSEDDFGLKMEGRLIDTAVGTDVYKLMKASALRGLSIGYIAREVTYGRKESDPRRVLKSVDLIEVSALVFQSNALAQVTAVKAAEEIKTTRDFEGFLRDAGGFSNSRAKAIASHGFKAFDAERDAGEGLNELAASLRRSVSILQS